jgi:hypothetical protein
MDLLTGDIVATLFVGGIAGLAVVIIIVAVLRRFGYQIHGRNRKYSDSELKSRIKEKTISGVTVDEPEQGQTVGDQLTSSGVWKIVDEVDAHISRKEYDLAEKWASIAVASQNEEEQIRAQLQLAEIYYLTRRNDAFLEIAADLMPKLKDKDKEKDWSELLSTMGRKIDPENPLFAAPAATAAEKKTASKSGSAPRKKSEGSDPELLASIARHIENREYRLAEKLISAALYGNPVAEHVKLKVKLAEIYFHTDKKEQFKKLAAELFSELSTKEDWRSWEKMMEMGRQIAPRNPLFINAVDEAADEAVDEDGVPFGETMEKEISTSGIYKILDFVESLIQENEYTMAEQWARKAIGSSGNIKAKLLLAKIYYLTDRKDEFLKLATEMSKIKAVRDDKEMWNAMSEMVRDIDSENKLFKPK